MFLQVITKKMNNRKKHNFRQVHGILLLNKAQGISSNIALQQVKRLYAANKAGHTGSLDPLATGMLPICFGNATKFCQYLLEADKVYRAKAVLGITTNTGDVLGDIMVQKKNFNITESALMQAIFQYIGCIMQVPPMFSALKHKGIPLYKYARKNVLIERVARPVQIFDIKLQAFDGTTFDIVVSCSKGTYIRSLVEDIGNALGVGAHLVALQRISVSGFQTEKMLTLATLQQSTTLLDYLLPIENTVSHLPKITLNSDEINLIRQGRLLFKSQLHPGSGLVALFAETTAFLGVGEYLSSGVIRSKQLLPATI